jgi:hypothetical protein
LINQQSTRPPIAYLDPEKFAKESFDTLWKEVTTVKPQVDLKALVTELRKPDKEVENEVYQ